MWSVPEGLTSHRLLCLPASPEEYRQTAEVLAHGQGFDTLSWLKVREGKATVGWRCRSVSRVLACGTQCSGFSLQRGRNRGRRHVL